VLNVLVFAALLAGATAFAFARGGGPERWIMATILAGSLLTLAADRADGEFFNGFAVSVFVIDLAVLGIFAGVALNADRYWPLCVAALQTVTIMVHLARILDVEIPALGYATAQAIWGYAMILLVVAGTHRHRQRLRRFGRDRSWLGSPGPTSPTEAPDPRG
jgi:hypothetical protein